VPVILGASVWTTNAVVVPHHSCRRSRRLYYIVSPPIRLNLTIYASWLVLVTTLYYIIIILCIAVRGGVCSWWPFSKNWNVFIRPSSIIEIINYCNFKYIDRVCRIESLQIRTSPPPPPPINHRFAHLSSRFST